MFEDFKQWLVAILPAQYTLFIGEWVETAVDGDKMYLVIIPEGGPATNVDDRRKRYRVILLGRRNQRDDAQMLMSDIESIVQATLNGPFLCEAANIRTMSEPFGPGFTTEDRAWFWLNLEVTF